MYSYIESIVRHLRDRSDRFERNIERNVARNIERRHRDATSGAVTPVGIALAAAAHAASSTSSAGDSGVVVVVDPGPPTEPLSVIPRPVPATMHVSVLSARALVLAH